MLMVRDGALSLVKFVNKSQKYPQKKKVQICDLIIEINCREHKLLINVVKRKYQIDGMDPLNCHFMMHSAKSWTSLPVLGSSRLVGLHELPHPPPPPPTITKENKTSK